MWVRATHTLSQVRGSCSLHLKHLSDSLHLSLQLFVFSHNIFPLGEEPFGKTLIMTDRLVEDEDEFPGADDDP